LLHLLAPGLQRLYHSFVSLATGDGKCSHSRTVRDECGGRSAPLHGVARATGRDARAASVDTNLGIEAIESVVVVVPYGWFAAVVAGLFDYGFVVFF
jgi:hypothetical protein